MAQMRAVSEEWRGLRGGERGFSIGRFAPDYLSGQRLYLAWKNQRLCGFASFHQGENEWALDLMRYTEDAPSGTMQSLISHAIADAAKADIPRLSLAAVPLPDLGLGKRWMALAGWLRDRSRLTGLDRFKSSFAPCRAPLYLAAPNWPVLAFAAFEIARAIRRPTPLDGRNQSKMHGPGASIQDHLDEVAFDNS
jgi:phosphatidylglycerol lysyltransferase